MVLPAHYSQSVRAPCPAAIGKQKGSAPGDRDRRGQSTNSDRLHPAAHRGRGGGVVRPAGSGALAGLPWPRCASSNARPTTPPFLPPRNSSDSARPQNPAPRPFLFAKIEIPKSAQSRLEKCSPSDTLRLMPWPRRAVHRALRFLPLRLQSLSPSIRLEHLPVFRSISPKTPPPQPSAFHSPSISSHLSENSPRKISQIPGLASENPASLPTCPKTHFSNLPSSMIRLAFHFLALVLLAGSALAAAKPNVLFIAIDDQNDWIGCLGGHPQVQTPRIDGLARRGTLFTNAHCQAPLCNPSRSSLLTGLRPSSTGIYGLAPGIRDVEATRDLVTLPQTFRRAGYFTYTCGKIYHDGSFKPEHRAAEFQEWGPAPGIGRPPRRLNKLAGPQHPAMDWGPFPEKDEEGGDYQIADGRDRKPCARRRVTSRFSSALGFRLPHVPCFAPQKWFDLYPDATLADAAGAADDDRDDTPRFSWYLHWQLPEPRLRGGARGRVASARARLPREHQLHGCAGRPRARRARGHRPRGRNDRGALERPRLASGRKRHYRQKHALGAEHARAADLRRAGRRGGGEVRPRRRAAGYLPHAARSRRAAGACRSRRPQPRCRS